jgi:hypothetical protein
MSNISLQVKYKPLVISHLLRPIGEKFTSSFAMNVEWDETIDEKELKKEKQRFTKFLTKFAKKEERESDGLKGGITVHIMAPEKYMDKHLSDYVKPKKFEIQHWDLIEKWWMIPDKEMAELKKHYREMSKLTSGTLEVFEKISVKKCNRVPSKFKIRFKNEIIWILLANLPDYQFGRYSTINETVISKGNINNKISIDKIQKNKASISPSYIINHDPPTRVAPLRPTRKNKTNRTKFGWVQLPKSECRISLVKVLGEYWGWDFFYTQFRIKKKQTPMSKSEIVIKEIESPKFSLVKHLIWCFREHRLWFESINEVKDTLLMLL